MNKKINKLKIKKINNKNNKIKFKKRMINRFKTI